MRRKTLRIGCLERRESPVIFVKIDEILVTLLVDSLNDENPESFVELTEGTGKNWKKIDFMNLEK